MPPRLKLLSAHQALPVLRPTPPSSVTVGGPQRSLSILSHHNHHHHYYHHQSRTPVGIQRRWNSSGSGSDSKHTGLGEPGQPSRMKGPTEDALPHVSEEAAATDRIMSKEKSCDGVPSSPELEQGTPVSEILQRDQEAAKHAPKVMQDMMKNNPSGGRSFSTSIRRALEHEPQPQPQPQQKPQPDEASAALVANLIAEADLTAAEKVTGLKFAMPEEMPKTENFRTRYEPLLEQFTKLLMEDGKLTRAQKNMNYILDQLRTSSPPQPSSRRPLLPSPPAPQLPLNPALYLTLIVDSVAPLIKIRNQKGIAGGGAAVQIPVPLMERQRRRTAIKWIIDASAKRRDSRFAARVVQELISVAEGKSGVWDRREQVHKLGVAGRANLGRRMR